MKSTFAWFALATMALPLTACTTFGAVSGQGLQSPSGHTMQPSDRLQLKVSFSHPLDRKSVVLGKTFILTTEKRAHVRGSLYFSPDNRSLTFRSRQTLKELFTFDPDGHFNLRIIGTDAGNGAIRNTDGTYLDGDDDDAPGGNYDVAWVITGPDA